MDGSRNPMSDSEQLRVQVAREILNAGSTHRAAWLSPVVEERKVSRTEHETGTKGTGFNETRSITLCPGSGYGHLP